MAKQRDKICKFIEEMGKHKVIIEQHRTRMKVLEEKIWEEKGKIIRENRKLK